MKKIIYTLFIAASSLVFLCALAMIALSYFQTSDTTQGKQYLFTCTDNKSIEATFYPEHDTYVDLILSDGRSLSLPHAISASGARYANQDESIVFWNKGDTAFITENDVRTYDNCAIEHQANEALYDYTDWELHEATDQGVSFLYPSGVASSPYIHSLEWPPQIEIAYETFFACDTTDVDTNETKIYREINGASYCISSSKEGATGSVFTRYQYSFPHHSGVGTLTFTLQSVQCMNYDEPDQSECTLAQENFDVDTLVDAIVQSLEIL